MKLGIIGAMEQEVETLVAQLEETAVQEKAGATFYEGILNGLPAVVVRCGIGKVNAALCVQLLCDVYGVTHVVNTGIAGSLDGALDIGDLLISRDAMHHDFDCCHFGYPAGKVPGMPVAYEADALLSRYAQEAAEAVHPGHVRLGRVASGDQFICSQAQKDRVVSVTGAQCTEMEGAGIAQAAYRNGVPFVIIRAISDKADHSAEMDYPTFERQAAHRCAQVTAALAKRLTGA